MRINLIIRTDKEGRSDRSFSAPDSGEQVLVSSSYDISRFLAFRACCFLSFRPMGR